MRITFLLLALFPLALLAQGSGDALTFDGVNDQVIISDDAALDIQEAITIEFWFLLEGESGNNDFPRVVSKGQNSGTNGAYGIFIKDVTDPDDIAFRFVDGGGTLRDIRSQSVPNYNDGEWHHVAATYSNATDTGVLYVDGLLEAAASITGNTQIASTADDLTIGTASTDRFFNGQVDDVRIWNVARTQQEVREFMCAKLTGSETGLVGYWNMDGATTGSGNVSDLTANNLDGTMTDMAADDVVTSGAPIGDESVYAYPLDWGGNALEFDGSDDYVDIGDVLIDGLSEITVEAWINPTALRTKGSPSGHNSNEGAIIHKSGFGDDNLGLTVASGGVAFYIDNGSNNTIVGTTPALNTWTHIAATYDGTNLVIYQDGVLDQSQASIGSASLISNSNNLRIGGGHQPGGSPHEFEGRIDEVRVWNYARTAAEITNDRCRSLEGDESGLIGYWRLDELINSTTADDYVGSNDGTLTNMDATTDWVTADHSCSYTGFELFMASDQNDSFRVSSITGNPDGIHIYSVNGAPNTVNGISGLGDNNHYFGVWKVEGTSPTYSGTYYYDGNDSWQATPIQVESDLILYTRDDNADGTWADGSASLNASANTLTATAVSTEFILGLTSGVLPIDLLDFQAEPEHDQVRLTWTTATEWNNDYFEVERSADGQTWKHVLSQPGAGVSKQTLDYFAIDLEPYPGTSYYRLRQVDFDGQSSLSDVRVVSFDRQEQALPYPNPTSGQLSIQCTPDCSGSIQVFNAIGQDVSRFVKQSNTSGQLHLDLQQLPKGLYSIRTNQAVFPIVLH